MTTSIRDQVSRFQAQQEATAGRVAKSILAAAKPGDTVVIESRREMVRYTVANVVVVDGAGTPTERTVLLRGDDAIGLGSDQRWNRSGVHAARADTLARFLLEAEQVQNAFSRLHAAPWVSAWQQPDAGPPATAALRKPRVMSGGAAARSVLSRNALAGQKVGVIVDVSGSASTETRAAYADFVRELTAAGVDVQVAAVSDKLVKAGPWSEVADAVENHQGGTRVDALVGDAWKAMGRPARLLVLTDGEMTWKDWPRRLPARTQVISIEGGRVSGRFAAEALSRAPGSVRRHLRRVQLPGAARPARVPGFDERTIAGRLGMTEEQWGGYSWEGH